MEWNLNYLHFQLLPWKLIFIFLGTEREGLKKKSFSVFTYKSPPCARVNCVCVCVCVCVSASPSLKQRLQKLTPWCFIRMCQWDSRRFCRVRLYPEWFRASMGPLERGGGLCGYLCLQLNLKHTRAHTHTRTHTDTHSRPSIRHTKMIQLWHPTLQAFWSPSSPVITAANYKLP